MPVDERAKDTSTGDYIVIRALENGVNLIGMTRGRDTRLLHTEKLDKGEVAIIVRLSQGDGSWASIKVGDDTGYVKAGAGRNPDPARQDSFRPG